MRQIMPIILSLLLGLSFSSVSFAAVKKSEHSKKPASEMTKKRKSHHSRISKKEIKEDQAQAPQPK